MCATDLVDGPPAGVFQHLLEESSAWLVFRFSALLGLRVHSSQNSDFGISRQLSRGVVALSFGSPHEKAHTQE